MAAVADGSASAAAAAKEVEYQAGVQKLVDLLSKLNPAAKEFVPSSAAAASPPKKALSADAPVFDYHSIGAGNGGAKDSATDASFYIGSPQRRDLLDDQLFVRANIGLHDPIEKYDRWNGYINQGRRRANDRARRTEREDSIRRTVYVSELDHTVTEERLADIFATCGQVVDCRICGDPHSVLRFAFIEFSDEEGARTALNLGGTIFGFYPVRVLPSKTAILPVNPKFLPRTEDEKEMVMRTVYCTNIDKMVTQFDVKNFFEGLCGEVSRLRLLGDNVHSTRIAFVEFVHGEPFEDSSEATCKSSGI
ncbi:polyadenylate-binding protein-interacting protein 9-like [Panicum miliaceum]|uniref:Polyadenylate-binding protein-interacting protein 9-like n=1 Tax=Panicum miliaceum TaxID=4540 RepID=A0A3L6SRE1_PANMI|nr:polyadenylate-binding protein-interacting protein 9-like [Panicum miliaceum]